MSSSVYFVDLRARTENQNKIHKISSLLALEEFSDIVKAKDLTAIKIHFGEKGNDAFIKPIYVRPVSNHIKSLNAKPFITDTNTLYKGSRSNAVDHLVTAIENGFDYSVVGAPLIIADGLKSKNFKEFSIRQKHFEKVKLSNDIYYADSMIVMTHFKAHEMSGFGGAIKNLAMGVAPVGGKMEQHSTRPIVQSDVCIGCGQCQTVCPVNAITITDRKASIDSDICIGCGECITMCTPGAIALNWAVELQDFTEKMTEYAYGITQQKQQRIIYINFLMNISPDCDCYPWNDAPIVPDIGILASLDPIAIDKACYDLVNQQTGYPSTFLKKNHEPGKDKFKGVHEHTVGEIQFKYGHSIGLGSVDYTLIRM